jgi:hypothetical protein
MDVDTYNFKLNVIFLWYFPVFTIALSILFELYFFSNKFL